MRLFLSLPLDDDVRDRVAALQARLVAACDEAAPNAVIKWTTPETFHLTVLFLGEQTEAVMPLIHENAAKIARETAAPFRFSLSGASFFPRRGPKVKTILCGVADGASEWRDLATRAETALGAALNLPKGGGALVPHITLGRVKGDADDASHAALRAVLDSEKSANAGVQTATELALMQSVLAAEGATHNLLTVWKLGE